ncbi:MAG: flagellar hook-length control protein FliK [Caulobacteraceae bacterium]|nr:MAG: flagellar hook-length control protein FliK [Caulobacteraceae bacterium]
MTEPASILASFAQPGGRLAMGDATGAALGGFEALLGMLTQSLQDAGGKAKTPGETAPQAATDTPAERGDLAALLAQAGSSAWLTQALGQAPASEAEAPVTCAVPDGKSPFAGETMKDLSVTPGAEQAEPAATAPAQSDGAEPSALDALLRRQPPEAVDPAILDRFKPVQGQTAAQSLQSLLAARSTATPASAAQATIAPPSAEQAVQAAVVAQIQAEASGQAAAEAAARTTPETVAAPVVVAPPVDPKALAPRKTADGKVAKVEDINARTQATPVDTAEADLVEAAGEERAPVEIAAREAETAATPARTGETAVQTLAARLETVAAGAATLATQVRGAPETVAKLAAGILDKLEGRSTKFDMQLDPYGLGKVDVSVEIASDGKLTAQLGFDSAAGLSELRGRVQELRTALEQAGFSLADNALSFDFTGERRQQASDGQASQSDMAGKAFARALGALDEELAAAPIRYQARRGLDLLI